MNTCFQTQEVITIDRGEQKEKTSITKMIPANKLFVIEFIGINGFARNGLTTNGVDLYIALDVDTNSYPISVSGRVRDYASANSWRIFGSQQVRIYVKPGQELIITAYRENLDYDVQTFVALSGMLMDEDAPASPGNLTIG